MNSPSSKYLYGRTSTFGISLKMTQAEENRLIANLDPRTKGERLKAAADQLYASKSELKRVQTLKGVPRLMPHEERRKLIEAPFVAVVHGHSSAWGGVFIRDSVPEQGRRVWQERPEDEEWMKNRWEEK